MKGTWAIKLLLKSSVLAFDYFTSLSLPLFSWFHMAISHIYITTSYFLSISPQPDQKTEEGCCFQILYCALFLNPRWYTRFLKLNQIKSLFPLWGYYSTSALFFYNITSGSETVTQRWLSIDQGSTTFPPTSPSIGVTESSPGTGFNMTGDNRSKNNLSVFPSQTDNY